MKSNEIITDEKIKRGSTELIVQNNMSLIPISTGIALSGVLYVSELFMYLYASLGLVGLGALALCGNFVFRQEHFRNEFMKSFNIQVQDENLKKVEKVKEKLKSQRAVRQIELFQQKHNRFEEVLNEQLTKGSLAYNRLIGGFEQLNLIALNNIEKILNYEANMSNIDDAYIQKELSVLKDKSVLSEHEESEIQALNTRLDLKRSYEEKIASILSDNETALTEMDVTLASVTDLNKAENMQNILKELQGLAGVLSQKSESYI